jgi:uncharacterized protein (DUF433 family)
MKIAALIRINNLIRMNQGVRSLIFLLKRSAIAPVPECDRQSPVVVRYDKGKFCEVMKMTSASNGKPAIIRTERGLSISGSRITLYDVMDYVTAGYPPKFIRSLFNLTQEQINAALAYIEANRTEVEAEYQIVLKEAEELRQYYEEQNRELIARLAIKPPKPGMEAAWEKLQAQKAKHQAQIEFQA